MDFAKNDDDRRVLRLIVGWTIMGRPFLAPPGIHEERKVALRRAFDADREGPGLPRGRRQATARYFADPWR